jgi:thiamine pyrophosphokinase
VRAIVVAGGSTDPADANLLTDAGLVIAADGGATWLVDIGRRPDLLVGDLDSVDMALVAELERDGVPVERHPLDKDASDLELALIAARTRGATSITVLGGLGGARLDHALANVLLLADPGWDVAVAPVEMRRGTTLVVGLRGPAERRLEGRPGDLVSLLPVGGDVAGLTTVDLRYPLRDEPLALGRARGLSNVVAGAHPSLSLRSGTLLIVESAGALQ